MDRVEDGTMRDDLTGPAPDVRGLARYDWFGEATQRVGRSSMLTNVTRARFAPRGLAASKTLGVRMTEWSVQRQQGHDLTRTMALPGSHLALQQPLLPRLPDVPRFAIQQPTHPERYEAPDDALPAPAAPRPSPPPPSYPSGPGRLPLVFGLPRLARLLRGFALREGRADESAQAPISPTSSTPAAARTARAATAPGGSNDEGASVPPAGSSAIAPDRFRPPEDGARIAPPPLEDPAAPGDDHGRAEHNPLPESQFAYVILPSIDRSPIDSASPQWIERPGTASAEATGESPRATAIRRGPLVLGGLLHRLRARAGGWEARAGSPAGEPAQPPTHGPHPRPRVVMRRASAASLPLVRRLTHRMLQLEPAARPVPGDVIEAPPGAPTGPAEDAPPHALEQRTAPARGGAEARTLIALPEQDASERDRPEPVAAGPVSAQPDPETPASATAASPAAAAPPGSFGHAALRSPLSLVLRMVSWRQANVSPGEGASPQRADGVRVAQEAHGHRGDRGSSEAGGHKPGRGPATPAPSGLTVDAGLSRRSLAQDAPPSTETATGAPPTPEAIDDHGLEASWSTPPPVGLELLSRSPRPRGSARPVATAVPQAAPPHTLLLRSADALGRTAEQEAQQSVPPPPRPLPEAAWVHRRAPLLRTAATGTTETPPDAARSTGSSMLDVAGLLARRVADDSAPGTSEAGFELARQEGGAVALPPEQRGDPREEEATGAGGDLDAAELQRIAREVYARLRQRLMLERERAGSAPHQWSR